MSAKHPKVTAQEQVSIPLDVRRKLGVGSGFEDIHRALFSVPPESHSIQELKAGIRRHIRKRYARH